MSVQTQPATTVTNRIATTRELEANEATQLENLWRAYGHLYTSKAEFLARFYSRKLQARIGAPSR